ncbi:MAG: helix-turn-helix domain-containing protein [Saprospiraceae bacterium]|uniref:helix-turn-helix domain-containing protein n=1 Tax=Candidatus Brachybacter algidus TaxID=2982024 RepID=UPI001B661A3C|nr:helix-turn-helix domain-containing protein [Candidatus Brachybacter algidus]MBP7304568.1 helix-turn-helix domain-containing protein [Saprospiraceae bacterium]MBP7538935.1 helix-turn-helix domain-containing protein [Saprospiraceae bacterium]
MKTFEMQLAEINKIQIKPITNQSEFKEANKIIDLLIDANLIEDKKVRKRSLDILEAVSILANEYEKKHFPIPKPNPIEAIKERMEQLSLSQKDVAVYFGGENRVSEVLSGKRRLTLNMIRSLNKNLNISTDVLIGV